MARKDTQMSKRYEDHLKVYYKKRHKAWACLYEKITNLHIEKY